MDNGEYWARRFKMMEDAIKDQAYDYVKNLEKQFDAAIREIDTKMRAWYQRFAVNNNITLAEARRMLSSGELKEFKWTVQEYIEKAQEMELSGAWIKELENASARVHISRLDSLKYQLRQQAEILTQARIKATTDASSLSYTQSYYHTAFEVQRGLGVGWTMQALNEDALKKVLSRPWTVDNQTFTARCWNDKVKLVETVNQEITRMVATGAAPDKAIEAIAKQFNTSKTNAGRVVMTESAYFSSAAQRDCFNDLDVEQYRIVGTLDRHTCETCGTLDGKVFKMSDYAIGSTAPPFHPWCRCCTCPYFADMEGMGERYARDIVTGESYKVPGNMTYEQWKEKTIENELPLYRKRETHRRISNTGEKVIDKATYNRIIKPVVKQGADIRIADKEWMRHLNEQNASAITIGDTIIFRENPTVSDVIEETYHFIQNKKGVNDDKPFNIRTILNEIDAKKYLISVDETYKIPVEEMELTKKQLVSYEAELQKLIEKGEWIDEDN